MVNRHWPADSTLDCDSSIASSSQSSPFGDCITTANFGIASEAYGVECRLAWLDVAHPWIYVFFIR